MKKIILILIALLNVACASNQDKFYNPSFSCEKVKQGSIEYTICTNKRLSESDRAVSKLYNSFYYLSEKVRNEQRDWIEERNQCVANDCIEDVGSRNWYSLSVLSYNQRENINDLIETLQNLGKYPIKYVKNLDALKKSIAKRPKEFSKQKYADFLKDVALFHFNKDEENESGGSNLHLAIDLLEKIKPLTPNDAQIYLLQGRAYLRLFRFSVRSGLISSHSIHKVSRDQSYTTIPPAMKADYVEYAKLAQEQHLTLQLTAEEELIVKRQRMFFDYFSTFEGKGIWWESLSDWEAKETMYKKGFENICHEYVTMLNQMPDNNLTECSRYVNEDDSEFEFVASSSKVKELQMLNQNRDKNIFFHYFFYKKIKFFDTYEFSQLNSEKMYGGEFDTRHNICLYQYVDFKILWKKSSYKCKYVENYWNKYPNKRIK